MYRRPIIAADRVGGAGPALAGQPRVRALRAPIDVARADVLAASRWPNPRVTFDRESSADITENMTMVAQPLPITSRRRFDMQAASALVDASSNRADDAMRRRAGERGILELLDAYRTGSSARVRQAALDLATRQAELELEFVSGWEIP